MNKIVFHDVASGKMTAIIEGSGQRFHSNFIGGHRHICDARGQRWLLRDRQGTQTQQMYDFESGGFHLLPLEGALSPDGERVGIATDSLELVSPVDGQVLFSMPDAWGDVYFVEQWLLVHRPGNRTDEKVFVYRQRRDERLIGVLQLPEFWLTLLFAGALLASLRADYRSLRRQQPPPPAPSPAAGEGAA